MDFNNKFPQWKNEGKEPSKDLLESGYQGGYKPPSTVFNWFWSKVMKAITELQSKLSGHAEQTTADLAATNTKIDGVQTTVEEHESEISTVKTTVAQYDDKIAAVETVVGEYDDKITSMETKVGEYDGKIAAVEATVGTFDEAISTLQQEVSNVQSDMPVNLTETINEQSTAIAQNTAELGNKVDKIAGKGLSTNDYTGEDKAKVAAAVPNTRTVNGKPLTSNITLTAADVGAIPETEKGIANGVAILNNVGKIATEQIPNNILTTSGTTTGTASALVLTAPDFSLFDGALIRFKLHTMVTPNPDVTINVNGTGAKKVVTSKGKPLKSIAAGNWVTAAYSITLGNFVLQGEGGDNGEKYGNDVGQISTYELAMKGFNPNYCK